MNDREKAGLILSMRMNDELLDPPYPVEDHKILDLLLDEINSIHGTSFSTHVELASLRIPGAGEIVAKYISQFSSEFIKMELLHHMVTDKIKNCGQLLLQLYADYKLKAPSMPPYPCKEECYDNAFRRLRSKRIKNELAALINNPIDAFALPLTTRMVASWKIPSLKDRFIEYVEIQNSPMAEGLKEFENYDFFCRELRFSALDGLKYYPSDEVVKLLKQYTENDDVDVRECANSSLAYVLKDKSRKPS